MLENRKINGTEEIGLVTPTPAQSGHHFVADPMVIFLTSGSLVAVGLFACMFTGPYKA